MFRVGANSCYHPTRENSVYAPGFSKGPGVPDWGARMHFFAGGVRGELGREYFVRACFSLWAGT